MRERKFQAILHPCLAHSAILHFLQPYESHSSSALKMVRVYFSKLLVSTDKSTRCQNPENYHDPHHHEDLKSHIICVCDCELNFITEYHMYVFCFCFFSFQKYDDCSQNSSWWLIHTISHLAVWVGVLAADPFFPSREARCCSRASRRLLGACKHHHQSLQM